MSRARSVLAARGKKRPPANQPQPDDCHSRDVPSCRLLHELAVDIFPEIVEDKNKKSAHEPSSSSVFGRIVRKHLLEQRQQEHNEERIVLGKKKRKRKKKKAPSGETTCGTSTNTSDGENLPNDTTSPSTTEPAAANTPGDSTDPVESSSPPTNDTLVGGDERTLMVQRWLSRIAASTSDTRRSQGIGEESATLQNRDLASFLDFLAKQRESSVGEKTKKKKAIAATSSSWTPTISIADVQAAYLSMSCLACRQSVEAYLRSMQLLPSFEEASMTNDDDDDEVDSSVPIRLSPSSVEIPRGRLMGFPMMVNGEREVERAFDYVAMEEGLVEDIIDDSISVDTWKLSFQRDRTNVACRELRVVPMNMTVSDVERLVLSVLLPCGLPEVEDSNAYPLQDSQMYAIQAGVKHFSDEIIGQLRQAGEKLQELKMIFTEVTRKRQQSEFDVSSSTKLRDCDLRCDEVTELLLMILFRLTKEYFALSSLSSEPWADECVCELWESYQQTLSEMMQAEFLHVGAVLQLASRPGVVPQMFLSAKHRSSTSSMVGDKARSLAQLHEKLETGLLVPQTRDSQVPFLRKLLGYKRFFQTAIGDKGTFEKRRADNIDHLALRLMKDYTELTNTVYCVNVNEILDRQTSRCDTILDMSEKLQSELAVAASGLSAEAYEFSLEPYGETLRRIRNIRRDEHDEDRTDDFEIKSRLLCDYRELLDVLLENVLSRWRRVRAFRALERSKALASRTLPLRLSRWLSGSHDGHVPESGSTSCEGGCGERRVSGILGGLLYRWMTARCNEWHAELAQNELLEGMDTFGTNNDVTGPDTIKLDQKTAKPKKAKKRRENKTSGLPASMLESSKPDDSDTGQVSSENLPSRGDDFVARENSSKMPETDAADAPTNRQVPKNDLVDGTGWTDDDRYGFTSVTSSKAKGRRKVKAEKPGAQTYKAEGSVVTRERETSGHDKVVVGETEASQGEKLEKMEQDESSTTASESVEETRSQKGKDKAEIPVSNGVGVIDASGFQSAESFLVERLIVVLRSHQIMSHD